MYCLGRYCSGIGECMTFSRNRGVDLILCALTLRPSVMSQHEAHLSESVTLERSLSELS